MREYCEQPDAKKLDNLDEIEKFPETKYLSRLNMKK